MSIFNSETVETGLICHKYPLKNERAQCFLPSAGKPSHFIFPKFIYRMSKKKFKTCIFIDARIYQNFDVPYILIDYIYSRGDVNMKQKLQKCCKQIFLCKKTLFCRNLQVLSTIKSPQYEGNSLFVCSEDCTKENLKQLYVINLLRVGGECHPFACSRIVKNIHRLDIQHLVLYRQNLTVEELKFLSTENLKSVTLRSMTITDPQNQLVSAEVIIESFPFPSHFR